MESLKQEMLHHEFIFRNQVRELHRLYWTQKNLMNEFRLKRFESHASRRSSLIAPTGNKVSEDIRNAFLVPFQVIDMQNSLPPNVGALEEFKGQSSKLQNNQETDLCLGLPADDFIRSNFKAPALCHPRISQVKTVDGGLGMTIAENNVRHSAKNCKNVINLEDSIELECHEETDVIFSIDFHDPVLVDADLFGTQKTVPCGQVSSNVVGNYMYQMGSMIHLNEANDRRLLEQMPTLSYVGPDDSCMATSVNQRRRKQQACPMPFDLNNMPLEHVERNVNSPVKDSNTASKPSSQNRGDGSPDSKLVLRTNGSDDIKNSTDLAYACQIEAASCEKPVEGSTGSNYQVFVSINAASISSAYLPKPGKDNSDSLQDNLQYAALSDVDIKRQDSNLTSSDSTNLLQTVVNSELIAKPANHEGNEEDTSSSNEDRVLYAHSRKSVCNSLERSADDSVTTQLTSPQHEASYIVGQFKPEEPDGTVSAAAEILMDFSSGFSSVPIEQPDLVLVLKPESNDTGNLPQYSTDSFEYMTLQLSEVPSDTMLEPSSGCEMVKNGGGHRLRRGRGFQDFQKEILPGLLTLSRHEIYEDLQNIGYKRRRVASAIARDSWLVPVRNRRSKLPCGRRRR